MIRGAPPPRFHGSIDTWARQVSEYLQAQRVDAQRPRPMAPQLLSLQEADDSAAIDGVLMFDREIAAPVVSVGGEYDPLAVIVDAPASASASGKPGQVAFDADYFYVCIAEDTWKRASLTSW